MHRGYDLATLHSRIRKLLAKIYPTKKPEDFTIQPRTLGIEFRESGLEMDLVPVLAIDGPGDYGWQPSSQGDKPVKTSVTKQLEFIRARKDAYANFTALVRLLKFWRNFHELDDSLRSFTIELIVSHLQERGASRLRWKKGFCAFSCTWLTRELKTPICFQGMRHAGIFSEGSGRNPRSLQRGEQRHAEDDRAGVQGDRREMPGGMGDPDLCAQLRWENANA